MSGIQLPTPPHSDEDRQQQIAPVLSKTNETLYIFPNTDISHGNAVPLKCISPLSSTPFS